MTTKDLQDIIKAQNALIAEQADEITKLKQVTYTPPVIKDGAMVQLGRISTSGEPRKKFCGEMKWYADKQKQLAGVPVSEQQESMEIIKMENNNMAINERLNISNIKIDDRGFLYGIINYKQEELKNTKHLRMKFDTHKKEMLYCRNSVYIMMNEGMKMWDLIVEKLSQLTVA